MRPTPTVRILAAAFALSPLAHATDWIVDDDGGPGVDFTTIQAAVDAAVTGDHVLVRSGTYAGFLIDGKGIVVAEEPGASAAVTSTVSILNTPSGTGVQLIGLSIDLSTTPGTLPFEAVSNSGDVLVARCQMRAANGSPSTDAAHVANSARVLFQECEILGGHASPVFPISPGGHGLRVSHTQVEVHGCTVRGGRGGTDWDGSDDDLYSGESGGSGLRLLSGGALTARSTFEGGRGGNSSSDFLDARCPGGGGSAVRVESGSIAHYLCTFNGGAPGVDVGFGSCSAPAGLPIDPPSAATLPERTPICFGLYDRCPCGNESVGGKGCDNSFRNGGARLEATGAASLAGDTLTLSITGIAAMAPALFFQGSTASAGGAGTVFGDGLRCAAGTVVRLGSRQASGGTASLGFGAGDAPLSVTGSIPAAGTTRIYQVWYRNVAAFCTSATFNFTNGYEIRWAS